MMDRRAFLTSAPLLAAITGARANARPGNTGARVSLKPEPLTSWSGQLSFVLDPPVPEWRAERSPSADRLAYTGDGYRLELDFRHPEPELLTFQFRLEREDKRPFLIRSYSLKTTLSLLGIHRVSSWLARLRVHTPRCETC